MRKGRAARAFGTGTILVGGLGWLALQATLFGGGCGAFTPQLAPGSAAVIVHAPTVSVPTIAWELQQRHSPLSADDAAFIFQQSQAYIIDDAFALALWAQETQDGATAFAGTHNIGNVTGSPGITVTGGDGVTRIFRVYASWQEAIAAWFQMVENLYVRGGHAPDLGTFALYYVHGLLPNAPGAAALVAQMAKPGGYVWAVEQIIGSLHAHEQHLSAGGTNGTSSGGGGSVSHPSLISLLPSHVSHAWASAAALQAAATLQVQNCQAGRGGISSLSALSGQTALLGQVFQIAGHLGSDGAFFDGWDGQAPAGVRSQGGVVWCTDLIASLYQVITRTAFPAFPDADLWMGTVGQAPGFHAVPPAPGVYPAVGEVVVLVTGNPGGHVALIVGVQPPEAHQPGFVLVVQGHVTTVLEKWTLSPDGTVRPPWASSANRTLGYIQIAAFASHAIALTQPWNRRLTL